jgi:NAD(P)-dependent dehydrogenase (short-subunit alcohol dehydrogenase family)
MGVLNGKVAIITGAGRGIGRGISLEYAAEGACVVVASRTRSTVDEVTDLIRHEGGEAVGVTVDVAETAQITAMVESAVAAFGTVDVLVNNAQGFGTKLAPVGVYADHPLEDYPEDEWDWMFDTGVKATLRCMKAVFPYMRDHGGKIINFGSRIGVHSDPYAAAYGANKEAIRALTRTAAREWGKYGISVNVINPIIETDSARDRFEAHPKLADHLRRTIPLGFLGQPREHVGRVAVFLAGPDSDYITGMTFFVEGGLTMLP